MLSPANARIVYYTDEHNDEFSTAQIKAIPIDEHYRYGSLTAPFCIIRFLYYRVFAMPVAWTYLKLKWHHKIIGKKEVFCRLKEYTANNALSSLPHSPASPAPSSPSHACHCGHSKSIPIFVYANHTNPIADALIPTFVSFPRSTYVIVHANNVSIPVLGQSTKYLGALPLPDNGEAARNFTAALAERVKKGASICIYPEAHIWPYCTWIRDFPDVSFRYPVQYNAPVICFTNTYQSRRSSGGKREEEKEQAREQNSIDKVDIITYIDGPFFPDKSLPPKARRLALRNAVYNAMTKRAKMSNAQIVKYIPAADAMIAASTD